MPARCRPPRLPGARPSNPILEAEDRCPVAVGLARLIRGPSNMQRGIYSLGIGTCVHIVWSGAVSPAIKILIIANVVLFFLVIAGRAGDRGGVCAYSARRSRADSLYQLVTYMFPARHAGSFHPVQHAGPCGCSAPSSSGRGGRAFFTKYYFITGIGAALRSRPLRCCFRCTRKHLRRDRLARRAPSMTMLLAYGMYFTHPGGTIYMYLLRCRRAYFVMIVSAMIAFLSSDRLERPAWPHARIWRTRRRVCPI